MTEIPYAKLSLSDVPPPGAEYKEIIRFALTFNAYESLGSFEAVSKIANRKSPKSLEECRTCLFFEQRRYRHFGWYPEGDALAYIHRLVEQIRQELLDA